MVVDPNMIAYLALLLWFPISILLFAIFRPTVAVGVVLLGSYLFLPVRAAFDFPGFPALDKELIANLAALAGFLLFAQPNFRRLRPGRGIESLVLLLMGGAVLTAYTNRDTVVYASVALPAMGPWDAASLSIQDLFRFGVPFFLGRVLFRRSRDLRFLVLLLASAGLIYSLLILFEIRMSPNLHRIVYGYHQHRFHQTLRLGGYRPMVFLQHGIPLSLFVLAAAISATALAKGRLRIGSLPAGVAAAYLSAILVLCRSLGSILYGVWLLPVVAFTKPRSQLRIASILAALVVVYPAARAMMLFPTHSVASVAAAIDEERAASLEFRLNNEDELFEKAGQRIWFGWGTYNRNRVFDPVSGEDLSVTDGFWIIQMGSRGLVGFVGAFGLLLIPIWRANRQVSRIRSRRDRVLLASLSLLAAIYAVDLLPNGFISPVAILLVGALTGLLHGLQVEQDDLRARRRRMGEDPSRPFSRKSLVPGEGIRSTIGQVK